MIRGLYRAFEANKLFLSDTMHLARPRNVRQSRSKIPLLYIDNDVSTVLKWTIFYYPRTGNRKIRGTSTERFLTQELSQLG